MRDDDRDGPPDASEYPAGTDADSVDAGIRAGDGIAEAGSDDGGPDEEGASGNVAGEFRPSGPIEPGNPRLENAAFVIAGAYVAVLALTRLFVDVQGFDARDVLLLTALTLAVGLVSLGYFGLLTPDT